MPYVVIENFTGGLDLRRLPAVSTPGSLLELTNAHITRGGEIEKRKEFLTHAALPSNTFGLAANTEDLWVFGSVPEPSMPTGVKYQRLQHPDGHPMVRVHSWDLYAGKFYVAAEFSNGDVLHFYDGERVENWFDGKARGGFSVNATDTKTGTRSRARMFFAKDAEELAFQMFMTNVDNPDEPIELMDEVTILPGDTLTGYLTKVREAINAKSSETGVQASFTVGFDFLDMTPVRAVDDFDGRAVWARVREIGIYAIRPGSVPSIGSCSGDSSCTNVFTLDANVQDGNAPFTYEWTIVETSAASATLDDSTAENPTLRVTNTTQGDPNTCIPVSVTIHVKVTDDTAQEREATFVISSRHCPPTAFSSGGGDRRNVGELSEF